MIDVLEMEPVARSNKDSIRTIRVVFVPSGLALVPAPEIRPRSRMGTALGYDHVVRNHELYYPLYYTLMFDYGINRY